MDSGTLIFILTVVYMFQLNYLLLHPFLIYEREMRELGIASTFKGYISWIIEVLGKDYLILALLPVIGGVLIVCFCIIAIVYACVVGLCHKLSNKQFFND